MIQTSMTSFKQTHANENDSTINNSQYKLKKYSGVPWNQHRLSILNIIFRETPNSVVIT